MRKSDLEALDMLIRDTASKLGRWFYAGASEGQPDMRMSLVGYGSFRYEMKSGERLVWPIVGVALQKNYMTLRLDPNNLNLTLLSAPSAAA